MFKNEEGFSLLELVVAVGVAGIIAAVALPTFAGLQDKATTTGATYAASASAAEALANSTIGGVSGNTSNASNGGSTSSNSSSSQAPIIPITSYTIQRSDYEWNLQSWANVSFDRSWGFQTSIISSSALNAITTAIANGATTVTVDGVSMPIRSSNPYYISSVQPDGSGVISIYTGNTSLSGYLYYDDWTGTSYLPTVTIN